MSKKKVSIKTMESLVKHNTVDDTYKIDFEIDGNNISFDVKQKLNVIEQDTLVTRVANGCFINGEYHGIYLSPLFDITVVQLFIPELPVFHNGDKLDFDKTLNMIQALNIVEKIKETILDGQTVIHELFKKCVDALEFKKQQMIAMTSPLSELLTSIKSAVDNMDMSKATDILEMASKMNKAGLNDSGEIIDAIVKNASTQKNDENVQKDNVTPIPSHTEDN